MLQDIGKVLPEPRCPLCLWGVQPAGVRSGGSVCTPGSVPCFSLALIEGAPVLVSPSPRSAWGTTGLYPPAVGTVSVSLYLQPTESDSPTELCHGTGRGAKGQDRPRRTAHQGCASPPRRGSVHPALQVFAAPSRPQRSLCRRPVGTVHAPPAPAALSCPPPPPISAGATLRSPTKCRVRLRFRHPGCDASSARIPAPFMAAGRTQDAVSSTEGDPSTVLPHRLPVLGHLANNYS